MDVGRWLRSLGLEQYEAIFRENRVDEVVLPKLTAEDLKELGVSALGDRKLLDAIVALRDEGKKVSPPEPSATTDKPATKIEAAPRAVSRPVEASGERRHVTVMFCDLVDSTSISAKLDAEE